MLPDADRIARTLSAETGLPFTGRRIPGAGGDPVIELVPTGHPPGQTFVLTTRVGWRSLAVTFQPGAYSGDLVREMGLADDTGRSVFASVLSASVDAGAAVELTVNGAASAWDDSALWAAPWSSLRLELRRGQLPLQSGDPDGDVAHIEAWTGRIAAAVVALLPLEEIAPVEPEVIGFPEGAVVTVQANRYERDRRNRAATGAGPATW